MIYVLIGLRRSGRCLPTLFACANVRFCTSGYSSIAPMSFLHECLLRKSCTPGLPFFSLPSFSRAGWGWVVSGCPCVASRGFSSPSARLWSSGRGGGSSGRAFGARELASVSSVHSWTRDSGVALLRRTPATCSVPVRSPSSTARSARCWGGRVFGGVLCSRLPLPPHLCTLSEVVGRVSRPSAAPIRVLPGLPILGLGNREGV